MTFKLFASIDRPIEFAHLLAMVVGLMRGAATLLLLWIGLAPHAGAAQDRASLSAALGALKQVVLVTPGKWHGDLREIAEAYRSIGDLDNAHQALADFEAAVMAGLATNSDPRTSLSVLASAYRRVGNFDAIARFAPMDPLAQWAVKAVIRAGNRDVLMELLIRPKSNFVDDDTADGLAAFVGGIAARQGTYAAMQAADELGDTVERLIAEEKARLEPGKTSYAVWMMSKGWPKSVPKWLADILVQANREGRTTDALHWALRSKRIAQDDLDQAIAAAILHREEEGDETAFDRFAAYVQDHKVRISILGYAALHRLQRGRSESAAKPAALFLNDDEALKQGARINVKPEFRVCRKEDKTGLALDRHHKITTGEGAYCSFSYGDKLTLSLGPYLAQAKLTELARIVFDYALVLGRIPSVIDNPPSRGTRLCPSTFPATELAEAYLRAGAKDLVREYAEHLAYVCPITESSAFRVGRLLAVLDSPAAVRRLLQSRSYTSGEAADGLRLGLGEAFATIGDGRELEALLPMIAEQETAIYRVNLGLPDLATPAGRLKAHSALRATLPYLAKVYLKPDREDLSEMRAPGWLLNAVRADLAAEVLPFVETLIDQTVRKLNALGTLTADNSFDVRKYSLGLGTLFLALVQAQQSTDPSIIAARVEDDYARVYFLAVAAEALAISGNIEGASSVARQIPTLEERQIPADFFPGGPRYAWRSIGEAIARAGDLAGSYRFLAEHKATYPLMGLFEAYREGLTERTAGQRGASGP